MNVKALKSWLSFRERRRPCTTVVLHATAGSTSSGAIATLIQRRLSYHYLVEKDGTVIKCVPTGKVAFHAGVSFGPEGNGVNDYSIGIALVNRNDGLDPYTAAQMTATKKLVRDLRSAIPTLKWITTHREISWPRKNDPRKFDLFDAARAGLFAWRRKGVPAE